MAARRRKPRSLLWTEVPLTEPNEPWWKSVAELVPLDGNVVAVNVDFVSLALVEAQRSGKPRTLCVPKLHARPVRVHFLPEWPMLAIFSDESIELLDISDPTTPTQRLVIACEEGHERAIASMGEDFYVTHENGVAWVNPQSRTLEHLFDVPNDRHFASGPTALAASGSHLFVVGRDAGVNVFRRTSRSEFTHVRTAQKGYAPTSSRWWAPGVLVLTGNEDVIAVDTSVPEKSKLMKSCKLPKLDIESPLCRLNEHEAFVGGPHVRTQDLVASTIDFTHPLVPTVKESEVIGDPALDWHSSRAVRVGDQIFAGSVYLDRMHVFRRS